MIEWTLTLAGTNKTLADWRISGVQLNLSSLTSDQLSFIAPRSEFDEDEICAYGAACELIRTEDGVAETWFVGTRQLQAGQADVGGESQSYIFDGPWRWLAENIFQQPWGVAQLYTDHVILNQNIGNDIKAVLDYAIANGALFQYVTAELTALAQFPPADEITGQLCAEVIRSRLQFAPDAIHWFDYTTSPPTFRLAKRGSLTAASVRMGGYLADTTLPRAKVRSLRPRPDLQVPSVKINGETIVTVDDVEYLVPSVDIYPPGATGREDGALNATITLQGATVNNIFGAIECQTVVTSLDAAGVEWVKQHVHTLRDDRIIDLTLASIERLDENGVALPTTYPRELIDGQIAEWMGLNYQTEIFKVTCSYQLADDDDILGLVNVEANVRKVFTFEIVTTDAPSGVSNYSIAESVDLGDPSIVGLAQYLYESLSTLHYDGAIDLEEDECSGVVSLGNTLNLLGSRSEYATMAALIQQVTFGIDDGTTSLSFGPPRHLNLSDILTLLQRFRTRRRWTNPDTQDTGELSGTGSQLELGKASVNTNAIDGAGVKELQVIKSGQNMVTLGAQTGNFKIKMDAGGAQKLNIDFANADWLAATNKEIKVKVVEVCVNNVTRRMLVLGSDPW